MVGRAMQEMAEFQCRKNRPSDVHKTELLMQEKTSNTRLEGAQGSLDQADGGAEGGIDQAL
jgi:hypothetical protein